MVKVYQYLAVQISEFNMMRHLIRFLQKRPATPEEIKDWFMRFKKLGSALSTTRMSLRLCTGIENLTYYLKQIQKYLKEGNLSSIIDAT